MGLYNSLTIIDLLTLQYFKMGYGDKNPHLEEE